MPISQTLIFIAARWQDHKLLNFTGEAEEKQSTQLVLLVPPVVLAPRLLQGHVPAPSVNSSLATRVSFCQGKQILYVEKRMKKSNKKPSPPAIAWGHPKLALL